MARGSLLVSALAAGVCLAACSPVSGDRPQPGDFAGAQTAAAEDDGLGPIDPADPNGSSSPVVHKSDARQPNVLEQLMRYDANHDGSLTRAEMEAGLRADFDAADTNHDGVLQPEEFRAVNKKRWQELASAATPLADWNGDGVVDFNEFAGLVRTLFDQLDANGDGVLSPAELHPQAAGQKPQPQAGRSQDGAGGGRGRPGGGRQ
jgi:Ca2+-binding EF-hand superfamily protein